MGASSSAINPTQDFSPKMGGGRLFDMGASTVKYGILHVECSNVCKAHDCGLGTEAVYAGVYVGMCMSTLSMHKH